jgi:hypothetical protein
MMRSGFNRPVAAIANGDGTVVGFLVGSNPPQFGQPAEAKLTYDQK